MGLGRFHGHDENVRFNAKDGETRYGINGWFGQAMVQSTGETFVKYDGSKFSNNISNPAIEEAGGVMEEIMSLGLYDPTWYGYLPDDGSTLFFGMADWALGASNVKADRIQTMKMTALWKKTI